MRPLNTVRDLIWVLKELSMSAHRLETIPVTGLYRGG